MASALKSTYADLFKIYPDAYRKDAEALRDFFAGKTGAGEQVIGYSVATFKVLCEFADFEAPPPVPSPPGIEEGEGELSVTMPGKGLTINLNIQLQLPETQDATIYDKIFKSLKEHLLAS